ncbi:uncharacterized protein LOC117902475 isoform X2 [Drosophila subobscura]|uniref:uncharacterized protein LOC117902475 isoform X2 n=1 Tax=Drosophila subobscura TaxID=7241 RepID=UPI00155A3A0E|nr:uncharacterized protein LOC117902475 isoform X2 [Drosophila subobscura]
MSPKYHHFEIALVYFLLLIPWPPTNVIKILCSRDNSRLVRKIVRSKWTPILDKHQVKLPLECPLHPFRDVFAPRQDAKQRDRPTQWTCRRCGKSFYQERHLDLHFDTRHKTIINEAMDSICLADFCDIMRCEVFETEDANSLKFGDHIVTDVEVWGDSLGQNSALAKANAAYLSLIPRTSTLGASRAAKVQNRQLLQDKPIQSSSSSSKEQQTPADPAGEDGSAARPKSAGEKLLNKLKELGLKRGGGGGDSTEPDAETKLNETEEEEEQSGDDAEASGQQDAAKMEEGSGSGNGVKARANCKPEELSKLKTRCELLLRSCIGGLLLSMSDQAFKEMEEEMNKAVCWYLTCDRYWEDGPLEPRAFPWGLIVILIFVLSTGICFCYYIIWILFDSEETTINANNHYAPGHGLGGMHSSSGSSSIYMPGAHHHYHVDYATRHDLDLDAGGIPGLTADQQLELEMEQQQREQQQQQQYYYQQQQQQQQAAAARDLYPEAVQYHRHSPRHYIADPRQVGQGQGQGQGQGTPTAGGVRQVVVSSSSNANTPLHHHPLQHQQHQQQQHQQQQHQQQQHPHLQHRHSTSLGYPQDILDRRDYTSSTGRPMATSVVSSASASGIGGEGQQRHYNTHPRPLETRHRHVGSSQQSLRASSSNQEIVQNEAGLGQNEHYIYVTYPPDLKKRYFDSYE